MKGEEGDVGKGGYIRKLKVKEINILIRLKNGFNRKESKSWKERRLRLGNKISY